MRVTCRQNRSDSGTRRRGNRAAHERLHVRRGGLERRLGRVVNGLRQVSQIGSRSGTADAMAHDGLKQVKVRAVGTHRRR